MSPAPAAEVFNLRCPDCAAELDGLEFDELFCCRHCAVAWDLPLGRRYPLDEVLDPAPAGAGERVLLPFWAFTATLSVRSGERTAALAAERTAERVRTLFVAAFAINREEYYGEPGLVWTRRQMPVELRPRAPGEPLELVGIRRTEAVAARYAEPYYCQLVDEQADITGVELGVAIDGPGRILGVAFLDQGSHLMDTRTGLTYPAAALEDLEGLRAASALARAR